MANLFAMCKELGVTPADEVCPHRDINYKFSYNTLVYEAYCIELEKQRKRK